MGLRASVGRRNQLRILSVQNRRVNRRTVRQAQFCRTTGWFRRRLRSGDASRLSAAGRSPYGLSQASGLELSARRRVLGQSKMRPLLVVQVEN